MTKVRITVVEVDGWAPGLGGLIDQVIGPAPRVEDLPAAAVALPAAGPPAPEPAAVTPPAETRAPRRSTPRPKGPAPKPTEPVRTAGHGRTARAEEIRRRIGLGESNAVIAGAVGVTEAAVYQHRRKLTPTSPAPRAKRARGEVTLPRFRCAKCGQLGYDPKRCDHCQERR